MTPKRFEMLLWQQLLEMHEIDAKKHPWAEGVSSDPGAPEFSFSIGAHAFFVVGLSPGSERWARRFPWPVLVFNDHAQFQRLREQNRFERFEALAQEMGTRAWKRIIVLADRAVKKRKRKLAAAVFEAALSPGMHERK